MLFTSSLLVAALTLGSSVVSALPGQSEVPTSTLTRRQNLAAANLCANVVLGGVNVPEIVVTPAIQAVAGVPAVIVAGQVVTPAIEAVVGVPAVITPAVTLNLGSQCICVDATGNIRNGADIRAALQLQGIATTSLDAVITALTPAALLGVATQGAQCPALPEGATRASVCGNTCAFTCPQGQTPSGNACVLSASAGARKRAQLALEKPGACAFGMQACSVIGISGRRTSKFECLDTKANIESCGGCMFPLRNQPAGEDCTLIPMVETVSCDRGRCNVQSCVKGFEVSESGDGCVTALRK